MTRYELGDVVLLVFPFTAGPRNKQRPGLVVLDTGDADVLAARITTQPPNSEFDLALNDWRQAGLLAPSTVRLHKLATLERNLVTRTLGRLTELDRAAFRAAFQRIHGQP
jgi:mRNA interferase MazF